MSLPPKPAARSSQKHPAATATSRTILILSGYLIGTTAAHVSSQAMEVYAIAAGIIGLLGYIAFASLSHKKYTHEVRRAIEHATVRLERHVDQHIRRTSVRTLLKLHASRLRPHEQYVTVVRSRRPIV
jgi:hypothetical protein